MAARTLGASAVALALLAAPPVQAQLNPGNWYINNQIYSSRVFNGAVANSMLHPSGPQAPASGVAAAGASTAFEPAKGNLMPGKLAAAAGTTPQARAQAQAALDGYITLYRQTAAKDGFPANDLAYAFGYFVVNSYQVHHDLVDMPAEQDPRLRGARDLADKLQALAEKKRLQVSPSQERALFEQFRQRLAADPAIRKMSDAEKQEAAESMAIAFGVTYTAYVRALGTRDDALADRARQQAREGLERLLGRPIAAVRLGPRGLEP
jgi:hypothetical protein